MPLRPFVVRPLLLAVLALPAAHAADTARAAEDPASAIARSNEGGFWSAGGTSIRAAAQEQSAADGRTYRLTSRSGEREVRLPSGVEIEEVFALRQGVFVSARDSHRDLHLALVDGEGWHALPSPATGAHRVRENAVPLTSPGGDLEGLVWLEGGDRQSYSIRYAAWNSLGWTAPEVLAGPAPGSQLALAGAALGDGSKLLVWSRFDGQDDEIFAARYADGRWSEPQAIAADNAVPDITPAVIAVPGGALASWSRYDGHDYRVVLARFDGRQWSAPDWAAPAGSTEPFLSRAVADVTRVPGNPEPGKAAVWLTFAHAQPRGWGVAELDALGRVLRRGAVGNAPAVRPVLEPRPTGEVRLRWAAFESDVELDPIP